MCFQIDALLGWRGPKTVCRYHVVLLLLLAFQLLVDILVWIDLGQGWAVALPYFPFYLSYFIMFTEETAYVNDAIALNARFKRLNCRLQAAVTNLDFASQNQQEERTVPRMYGESRTSALNLM